jgi:hypothetical protein
VSCSLCHHATAEETLVTESSITTAVVDVVVAAAAPNASVVERYDIAQ